MEAPENTPGYRERIKSKARGFAVVWRKFPEQIQRLLVVFIVAGAGFDSVNFGTYGHYRASALEEVANQEIRYAGHTACLDCHDDIVEVKQASFHKNVACEVCHGPAFAHTEGELDELPAPRERGYCPLCHEYLPSRPTGFPQIISASHNPMEACISCHEPHDPVPPETPRDCDACHGEIANTKALSRHVNIDCVRCHVTPEEHKLRPREVRPGMPMKREFCGECHDGEADSEPGIPRIDLATHEERYVCWQCHYPHLPEVN